MSATARCARGTAKPIYAYGRSRGGCTVIGGYVARDRRLGNLRGRYVFADLCEGKIRSLAPRLRGRPLGAGDRHADLNSELLWRRPARPALRRIARRTRLPARPRMRRFAATVVAAAALLALPRRHRRRSAPGRERCGWRRSATSTCPSTSPAPPASRSCCSSSSKAASFGCCARARCCRRRSSTSATGRSAARTPACHEQGLLSVAFPSDYEESRRFYVYFTGTDGDNRVFEFRRSRDRPARAQPGSGRLVLRLPHPVYETTTAAGSSSGRGISSSRRVTAVCAGTRPTTRRTSTACSGRSCASTPRARAAAPTACRVPTRSSEGRDSTRSSRSACAIRSASRSKSPRRGPGADRRRRPEAL